MQRGARILDEVYYTVLRIIELVTTGIKDYIKFD
jgi:hypothetical protein